MIERVLKKTSRGAGVHRRGYTLIELLVVNVMLGLLVVLISSAWRAFGPLCIEVIARGRVVNEANIAAQSIYQEASNPPPGLTLTHVRAIPGDVLEFGYGPATTPTYLVQYVFTPTPDDPNSAGMLVRYAGDSSVDLARSITVARHVESAAPRELVVPDGSTEKSHVEYTVTFAYRVSVDRPAISRSAYTFVIHN